MEKLELEEFTHGIEGIYVGIVIEPTILEEIKLKQMEVKTG